jgi:hypothetical protein
MALDKIIRRRLELRIIRPGKLRIREKLDAISIFFARESCVG